MSKVYIMGCGRSGTTYLLLLMSCFDDTHVHVDDAPVPGEDHYSAFARIRTACSNVVVKRASHAYEFVSEIPEDVSLLYLVRHPLDVCTSTLAYRGSVYDNYIPVERWLKEAEALRWVVETPRPRHLVVRYERLVNDPDIVQREIGRFVDLRIDHPFSAMHDRARVSGDIDSTLNGLRPPDPRSIGRWKEPARRAHVADVWRSLGETGVWFCRKFGYEVAEIESVLAEGVSPS